MYRTRVLNIPCLLATVVVALTLLPNVLPAADADADGFVSIFDGKSLDDWDGNPGFWRVEDGTITGQTTPENPTKGNTFLIWRGGEVGNFELKLQYRIVGGNSGIQYRSFEVEDQKWVVGGYQADIDSKERYSGINYGERFRGILADRGQETVIGENHKPKVVEQFGDAAALQSAVKDEEWNDYHIVAKGFRFEHRINGTLMSVCTDEDEEMRRPTGILALQLHAGPPMVVQFRNIRVKSLTPKTASTTEAKRVVFLAGSKSHGYGAHEHKAGSMLLAETLNQTMPGIKAEVYLNGWPEDDSVLDGVATIVTYADGGGRHPFNAHLERIDQLMDQGTGLVCIHYGVEVPKGDSGDHFLKWSGGYFEADWSVNPHWTAAYGKLPNHPITRGVKPFTINDEWYYHMRFREQMEGVQPILTALPPDSTLSRPDGPHSGNPYVRQAVSEGIPQHMAWATERADGGRGFGFTGGHFHWNWGHNEFRKLVLNAIVWTAKVDVPEGGVPLTEVTIDDLMQNQDYPVPENFNPARIEAMLAEWNAPQ